VDCGLSDSGSVSDLSLPIPVRNEDQDVELSLSELIVGVVRRDIRDGTPTVVHSADGIEQVAESIQL